MSSMEKKVVLVTGGKGLVGSAIADIVQQETEYRDKFEFIFLSHDDAELTDPEETRQVFEKCSPHYVINLAAKVGGLYSNMSDNGTFYQLNKAINNNVLHCSRRMKVKKCISCLSTCIFPAEIDYPIDETKLHLGPPHDSNRGYSMAKREVDLMNRQFNITSDDTLFTAVVPTNIYGPKDNFNLANSHVIPGLIHKAYLSASQAKLNSCSHAKLKVCGSGEPLRQFIYVKDLANLILWALTSYNDGNPIIFSPDESGEVSIRQIAEIIATFMGQELGVDMTIEFDLRKSDGQFKKTACNSKLKALYSDFKFTPVEQGLQETIKWFCETYPNLRR